MTKVIACAHEKGGVGKTTTTVNLGIGLVRQGKNVLLMDADPQGDLTKCLGLKTRRSCKPPFQPSWIISSPTQMRMLIRILRPQHLSGSTPNSDGIEHSNLIDGGFYATNTFMNSYEAYDVFFECNFSGLCPLFEGMQTKHTT